MSIKVSVVTTVYDTEAYLSKCFDSILGQTLKDIELIIINDGSKDDSQRIIDSYIKKDARINAVTTENRGVSKARNLGLSLATGECVLFVDSDDYLDREMLELMYNSLVRTGCEMAVCNFKRVFDDKVEESFLNLPRQEIIEPLADNAKFLPIIFGEKNSISSCVWNKLFKTDFIKKTGIVFEERSEIFAEDAFFVYKIIPCIKNFCIVDLPLYYYYQRKNSVTNTYKTELLKRCKALLVKTEEYYKEKGLYEVAKKAMGTKAVFLLIDLLYNENRKNAKYEGFKNILKDTVIYNSTYECEFKDFSAFKKIILWLYKKKLYLLIFIAFRLGKNRM